MGYSKDMPIEEAFIKETLRKTKYEASSRRNLHFSLEPSEVFDILKKQNGKCALTGWPLQYVRGGNFGGRNPYGCTLDRIDNTKGYTKDNVQLVCCLVNIIRGNLTMSDFTHMCTSVARTVELAQ